MMNDQNLDSSRQSLNPFLPSWEYIPDGEPHIFGDRLYLFGSHDRFNGTQFCMNDYVCWSCPLDDLSSWRLEGTIYRKEQDPAAGKDSIMQAPDVCRGPDGRYYLYYNLGLAPFTSVAVCDTPAGKYEYYGVVRYADGTPAGEREHDIFPFDPGILADEDGRIWLYTGFGPKEEGMFAAACKKYHMDGAYAMELKEDMLTVCSEPKLIFSKEGEHGFFEASSMRRIGSRYYFIYSSVQGHELCWAVGSRPDGPFAFGGTLVSNGDIGICEKARNYTGNTHGSLVQVHGQWYVFYHRQTNRHQYSRQACAEKIRFEDGRFLQAELTSCGLNAGPLRGFGRYEARIACHLWSREGALFYGLAGTPEAESHPYFTQTGEDREGQGDQYIADLQDGAVAGFKSFQMEGCSRIGAEVSGEGKGSIIVSTGVGEAPICTIPINLAGQRGMFYGPCPPQYGILPLYFTFRGNGSISFHSFILEKATD